MMEDKWDTGELGRSEQSAMAASAERSEEVDRALGLVMISIRLEQKMIDDLKFCARANGMKYQPFIRKALEDYCAKEISRIKAAVSSLVDKGEG